MQPLHIEGPDDLRSIVGGPALHRVSLYVPFDRAPSELHASELRLRAGIDRVETRLRERGVAEAEIAARLERLRALEPPPRSLGSTTRTLVWLGDPEGWALATPTERLDARAVVSQHYALRPLLHAFERSPRFRLLAVSSNRVAAYEGDAEGLRAVEVPGVPRSLEEALGTEVGGRQLSFRSDQPVPGQRSQAQIFHGQGGAPDARSLDRERYHRVLGAAISAAWRSSDVPIVLAAEVRTASELRKHAELPALLDEELRGNPDGASVEELHARARPVVTAALDDRARALVERFEAAHKAGKTVEREFDAVAGAAVQGRIRRLWVEEDARVPGRLDEMQGRRIEGGDADEDALDGLVAQVLGRGGHVHVVAEGGTPTGGAFCAELR